MVAVETLLRLFRLVRESFPNDDFETVAVYLSVAAASAGHALRNDALLSELAGAPLPDDLQRVVSGRAIAAATLLPRETVRRKLATLVEDGLLVREEGGVRIPSDTLNHKTNRAFADSLVGELTGASLRLSRFDWLVLRPSTPTHSGSGGTAEPPYVAVERSPRGGRLLQLSGRQPEARRSVLLLDNDALCLQAMAKAFVHSGWRPRLAFGSIKRFARYAPNHSIWSSRKSFCPTAMASNLSWK